MNLEGALAEIVEHLDSRGEWLIVHVAGRAFSLRRDEIELTLDRGKLFFGFIDEKGFQIWRVAAYKIESEKLTLDLTRNFDRERERINIVPRISAGELSAEVELARLEKANRIARLIVSENPKLKLVRVSLNEKNGRFAQIIVENQDAGQIAALADVADSAAPDTVLTNAILWFSRSQNRTKKPIARIWILAEKKVYKNLCRLHALLRHDWQAKILVKEISKTAKTPKVEIKSSPAIAFENLWRERAPEISITANDEISRIASETIKLAPNEIDLIFTRHGETLRFFGLPFARVRKTPGEEKAWFGIERERRILNDTNGEDFFRLLEELQFYRRFDSPNKRHEFYRLAPEAWLEAILRRNVKLLDSNLVLSPIYNQFRAARDKIDLLALRRDGRLVVIELKVEPDREMIFQAADYWRKIELQRRGSKLQKAKLFGEMEISDEPAIVYLVAPTLSFHPDFEFLSKTVSSAIEIYQFGLNENWRENLKVMKIEQVKSEN